MIHVRIRRIYSSAIASAILLLFSGPLKADVYMFDYSGSKGISKVSFSSGVATWTAITELPSGTEDPWYDSNTDTIYAHADSTENIHAYDISTDTWTETTASGTTFDPLIIPSANDFGNIQIGVSGDNEIDTASGNLTIDSAGGTTTIDDNAVVSGTLTVGGDVTINSTGLSVGGSNLIKRSDGAVHIGENSLITKEENGRQSLYSKDANGNAIPIDINNGTKLLINGRDVEQAIDNVGALSAALTGLPTVPQDSPLSCGVGTGTHSANFALSGGCASRINERLAFNAAASFIPKSQQYQGIANDAWSGRLGFVFKLGKINKPTLISMKEKKELQAEVKDLKSQNLELVTRLEKLETIALAQNEKRNNSFNLSSLFSSMRSFLISSVPEKSQ